MIRKIDNLGRIVIPKEICKQLGIEANENICIEVKDNEIVLTKNNTKNELEFLREREIKLQQIEQLFLNGNVDVNELNMILKNKD